jgi:DNA gyrase subunit A
MDKTISVNLSDQVKSDYLDYATMVLVGRAIPSLTDGLKPAQRRVLTAMKWLNLRPDGRYMKSARVEGETMGKLHPHGGAYGVMVTMAAPYNNNIPFIDGMGNWGSSTDGAAAARYTEAKLSSFAWEAMLSDSDTWQLRDNYDGSLKEPVELNVKVPAVLLNGQDGIGVGFATKIPPHSLRDVCNAVVSNKPLVPSFPSGCDIVIDDGLASYQKTGIGTLRLRAKEEIIPAKNKRTGSQLVYTNLPYGTNPEKLGQQIKDGLDKGTILGITAVRDDSDLTGDRLTITLKAGTDIELASKQLYYATDLDSKYSARLLVISGTKPVELSPSELIARWKTWRLDRMGVAFSHELDTRLIRHEVVIGLIKAISIIDKVIKCIRESESKKEALVKLIATRTLKFTHDQATAILEMRLHQLTGLDSASLEDEKGKLEERIAELETLIKDKTARSNFLKSEVKAIGTRHGEKRRSELIEAPASLVVSSAPGTAKKTTFSKPKFMKFDTKKGVAEQAKGPRGALILEKTDKVITVTADGTLRKVASNYKGPLGQGFSELLLGKKESEVTDRKYLAVFELDGDLRAMTINGEDMVKVTSKGKRIVPEGAILRHFSEKSYQISFKSARKKPILLNLTQKSAKPGGKGLKIAKLTDLQ